MVTMRNVVGSMIEVSEATFDGMKTSIDGFQPVKKQIRSLKTISWLKKFTRPHGPTRGKLEIKCILTLFMEIDELLLPVWVKPTNNLAQACAESRKSSVQDNVYMRSG